MDAASENVSDVFVAWDCHARAIFRPTRTSGVLCIGSLHALRGARDYSIGRTQHWLRSEIPATSQSSGRSDRRVTASTAKLLALSVSVFTVLPRMGLPPCDVRLSNIPTGPLALLGALISLAELGIAQSEERNQCCVLKSRFRCTTLRAVNR